MRVFRINGWNAPASIPAGEAGNFRVQHCRLSRGLYRAHSQYAGAEFFWVAKSGVITRLQEKRGRHWEDWMTDDPLYWHSMANIAARSHGYVLLGGLGLGLALRHLAHNPRVKAVYVVERSSEVIRLVWPHIKHLRYSGRIACLIEEDFFDLSNEWRAFPFDTVILDFWVGDSLDPALQELFVRTWEEVHKYWPNATQLFHGLQPLADLMKLLKVAGATMKLDIERWIGGKHGRQ